MDVGCIGTKRSAEKKMYANMHANSCGREFYSRVPILEVFKRDILDVVDKIFVSWMNRQLFQYLDQH